jgi:hypothetical protein
MARLGLGDALPAPARGCCLPQGQTGRVKRVQRQGCAAMACACGGAAGSSRQGSGGRRRRRGRCGTAHRRDADAQRAAAPDGVGAPPAACLITTTPHRPPAPRRSASVGAAHTSAAASPHSGILAARLCSAPEHPRGPPPHPAYTRRSGHASPRRLASPAMSSTPVPAAGEWAQLDALVARFCAAAVARIAARRAQHGSSGSAATSATGSAEQAQAWVSALVVKQRLVP